MKVLILEDEPRAANRLARLIVQIDPNIELLAKIGSVEEAVSWLENNESPDLIFMDVRLSDGDCFNIFDSTVVESPIVFSTAYSEYALRAFAVNSIDYLLKPIVKQDLERALLKYRNLAGYRMAPAAWPDFKAEPSPYKQQFLIAIGGRFVPVKSDSIVAIRSYLKAVQLVDEAGTEWLLDQSLSEVEAVLDPSVYFRVSRQWLIRLSDVHELRRDGSGYSIQLANLSQTIKVSRAKVSALKKRLAGKD
jgi:two-component system response regulator LytT